MTRDELIAGIRAAEAAGPAPEAASFLNDPKRWLTDSDYFAEANPGTAAAIQGIKQGGLFGLADEIDAAGAGVIPGGETYGSELDIRRDQNEQLQESNPGAYLAGEIGGGVAAAAIPFVGALSGPARGVQAATTAGKIASMAGRGSLYGGVDAALQGYGRGEGGVENRLWSAAKAAPVGAVAGATLAPLGSFLGTLTSRFGRTAAASVEKNLKKIAESTGLPIDEVLSRFMRGDPLAGVSDTTRMTARAHKYLDP